MQHAHKEIRLSQILPTIRLNLKLIAIFPVVGIILAVIYCLIATPIYSANSIINPPKLSDSGAGLSSVLGGVTGLGLAAGNSIMKSDAEISIAMLKTREVRDDVIKSLNLAKYYHAKNKEIARSNLEASTTFSTDLKSGFVNIKIEDISGKMASDIANYYAIALGNLISRVGLDQVKRKLDFYQSQKLIAKNQLVTAQNKYKDFTQKNGITAGIQTSIVTGISVQLQTQLAMSYSQLKSMSSYATSKNPDYQKLEAQINSMKSQILNSEGTKLDNNNNVVMPPNLAPELAQAYIELSQEVAFRTQIYQTLTRQYEISLIDSRSDEEPVVVQVIDPSQPPLWKSRPQRLKILLKMFFGSILVGIIYVIIRNHSKILVTALPKGDQE